MPSTSTVTDTIVRTTALIGRAGLHALLPDEFEYYAMSLELVDSQGGLELVFNFPVMPNSYSEMRNSLVNVKKTGSGIVSLGNNSFSPVNISIQGTFGRKLRILVQESSNSSTEDKGKLTDKNVIPGFDLTIKSGFGMTKLLEKINIESQQLDSYGKPRLLFLYNPALNHNYLVEIISMTQNQSLESNMIWNYTMELKALAPAEKITFFNANDNQKKRLQKLLAVSLVNSVLKKVFPTVGLGTKNQSVERTVNKFRR